MDFQGGMIVLIVFVSLFAIWLLFYFIPVGLWFSALVSGVRISLLPGPCANASAPVAAG